MATWTKEVVDTSIASAALTIDNVKIDGSNIGHTSDTDLMALASGTLTVNGIVAATGNLTVGGTIVSTGTITGTLATVAQGNITSLGTLTTLTVDNVIINGTTIGHTGDTDLLTLTAGNLAIDGVTSSSGLITATAGVKLGNNVIYASDGGATITLDTSDNVVIAGDATIDTGLTFSGSDASLNTKGSMKFYLDTDDNETGQEFRFYNYTTEIATLNESGDLQIDGDLTVSGGNFAGAVTFDGAVTFASTTNMTTLTGANADTLVNGSDDVWRFSSNDSTMTLELHSSASDADTALKFMEAGSAKWIMGNDATGGASADIFQLATGGALGSNIKLSVATTGDTYIHGDLKLNGNNIQSSDGSAAISLSSDDVQVEGNLTVAGAVTGATQFNNTITVGVDDTGYDVKFFGASAGNYWLYDQSSNRMHQVGTGQSTVKLETTLDSSSVGPAYQTYRNSPSPAASDTLGAYSFHGNDSNGSDNAVQYGRLRGKILDTTAGAEEGSLDFAVLANGSVTNAIVIEGQSDGSTDVEINSCTIGVDSDSVLVQSTSASSGNYNTIFGKNAGDAIQSGGNHNTLFGEDAGSAITTGDENTIMGYGAGDAMTTTSDTVLIGHHAGGAINDAEAVGAIAIGHEAMRNLLSGQKNVAIGVQALYTNTDGDRNVAIGYQALKYCEPGTAGEGNNTVVGYNAGQYVEEGAGNVFIGSYAGEGDTGDKLDGDENVAIGKSAGAKLQGAATDNTLIGGYAGDVIQTGAKNVAIGRSAFGSANNDESQNTAIGSGALYSLDGDATNTNNTSVGFNSGYYITTGIDNTHIGIQAGKGNSGAVSTGDGNTTLGANAGTALRGAAAFNTLVGSKVGDNIQTGTNNTMLGFHLSASAIDVTHEIVIGAGVDISNDFDGGGTETVRIGRASDYIECTFGTDANWGHTSDIRIKKDISDNELGLSFINELRTVNYKKKPPSEYPKEFKGYDPNEIEREKPNRIHYGFIAQEVKEVMDKVGHSNFPMWSEKEDGCQHVAETALIAPLVKAIQELSNEVKLLKEKQ